MTSIEDGPRRLAEKYPDLYAYCEHHDHAYLRFTLGLFDMPKEEHRCHLCEEDSEHTAETYSRSDPEQKSGR